eukprot:augustus_masked-scaffold_1-processed-gene-5.47-mRNA-1 protein AED:1.00 eAED:1.00 QI:0/-1/0/0/-1/1/1/0/245
MEMNSCLNRTAGFETLEDLSRTLPPFLSKLCQITFSCSEEVGGWSCDGKSFEVRDAAAFEQDVLPRFFKGCMKTFIRQLHFYGFRKTETEVVKVGPKEGLEVWSFSHPFFQRNSPRNVLKIRRKTNHNPASSYTNTMEVALLRQELNDVRSQVDKIKSNFRSELDEVKRELQSVRSENAMLAGLKRKSIDFWNDPRVFGNNRTESVPSSEPGSYVSEDVSRGKTSNKRLQRDTLDLLVFNEFQTK